jgi:hypothetical protein
MLAEAAARDFNNPEMAASLKATDLPTLDKKWREPSRRFSFRPSLRMRRSSDRSVPLRPSEPGMLATQPPTRTTVLPDWLRLFMYQRGAGTLLLLGLVAMGALGFYLLRQREIGAAPAPSVIMVEGSVATVGMGGAPPAPDPAVAAPAKSADTAAAVDSARESASSTPTSAVAMKAAPAKSKSELLTRAFARQQGQIAKCFTQHASDVSGSPEISVRFEVGTDGRVGSAQVQPAALGSTPLGQCIAGVARATEFGPQSEPVSFRIPITAKRGP